VVGFGLLGVFPCGTVALGWTVPEGVWLEFARGCTALVAESLVLALGCCVPLSMGGLAGMGCRAVAESEGCLGWVVPGLSRREFRGTVAVPGWRGDVVPRVVADSDGCWVRGVAVRTLGFSDARTSVLDPRVAGWTEG
jgi:hypothetical protein